MLEKLAGGSDSVLGYRVVGKVHAADYQELEADVQAALSDHDTLGLLIDLQEFTGEEVKAWLPDLKFGHQFHDKIRKMAIVGDKRWQKWLTALVDPFYADEARFFAPGAIDKAWAWLRADTEAA